MQLLSRIIDHTSIVRSW